MSLMSTTILEFCIEKCKILLRLKSSIVFVCTFDRKSKVLKVIMQPKAILTLVNFTLPSLCPKVSPMMIMSKPWII